MTSALSACLSYEVHQLKSTLRQLRQWQSTIVLLFVVYLLNDREKSDPAIVAVKLTNKAGQPASGVG
jgi:hypothetical protein